MLQFITGASGSGKSTYLYKKISKEAAANRNEKFIILVPDQFTLETQKTMVALSGKGGILNVDVLSFHRLAYRAFEEVPALRKNVIDDLGTMMILRKVFAEQKKNLKYFKRGLHKPGFLDECKSFLCECMQYALEEEELQRVAQEAGEESLMSYKIHDICLIFREFQKKMGDTYMTAEELIPQLTQAVSSLELLRGATFCLDGFTGFTPTQYDLIREIMTCCKDIYVTITTDETGEGKRNLVFELSNHTRNRLTALASETATPVETPVITGKGKEKIPHRLVESEELLFLEKNIFTYGGEPWKKEPQDISITSRRYESEEAVFVAQKIWHLVHKKGYAYEDIAVVTGDLETYEPYLEREMTRLGIRFFMDHKKSMGANVMAEYILSFFNMIRKGMDYESTFRFLRCGLSPLTMEETDVLENYVFAQGKKGLKAYDTEWEYNSGHEDLVVVNEYRLAFIESVKEAILLCKGGKKTVQEFSTILYNLIVKNELFQRIGEQQKEFEEEQEFILAKEYKTIYSLVMSLLEQLVTLLGDEVVTLQEYEELLTTGISQGLVGFTPPTTNQVMIGDVERSRLKDVKVLFFIGVNDSRIPKPQGSPGMLSEQERIFLAQKGVELAPLAEEQFYKDQFYLYLTLTKPSQKLYMTYSMIGSDGGAKRPAYLIKNIMTMFPQLKLQEDKEDLYQILGTDKGKRYFINGLARGDYEKDKVWWELAAYYKRKEPQLLPFLLQTRKDEKGKTKLSKEAVNLLYSDEIMGSPTRLERFAKCPYAHFITYGLGLKEREQYTIGNLDFGNVFHYAVEHFCHEMEEKGAKWKDLEENQVRQMAEDSISYVVENYNRGVFYQSKRTEFFVQRMKRMMNHSLWALWKQMKEGAFEQKYTEKAFLGKEGFDSLKFDLSDNKKMVLNGKIDRMDVCEKENQHLIKIMDYKTWNTELALDKVYHGLQLQLPIYMMASMELEQKQYPEKEMVPAAMLYYCMDKKEVEANEEEIENQQFSSMRCAGYVNRDLEIMDKLDPKIAEAARNAQKDSSAIIPVEIGAKGQFLSATRVMTSEEFEELMAHARTKMKEFGERIFQGDIQVAPYEHGQKNACTYCNFRGMCGIEKYNWKEKVNLCPSMKEDEVWEAIHGED